MICSLWMSTNNMCPTQGIARDKSVHFLNNEGRKKKSRSIPRGLVRSSVESLFALEEILGLFVFVWVPGDDVCLQAETLRSLLLFKCDRSGISWEDLQISPGNNTSLLQLSRLRFLSGACTRGRWPLATESIPTLSLEDTLGLAHPVKAFLFTAKVICPTLGTILFSSIFLFFYLPRSSSPSNYTTDTMMYSKNTTTEMVSAFPFSQPSR